MSEPAQVTQHGAGLRRIAMAPDVLVVQHGGLGKVWLFEGSAADAYAAADPDTVTAALGLLDDSNVPPCRAGLAWPTPDAPPLLDRTVAFGGPILRVRCWEQQLAPSLAAVLAPLAAVGAPVPRQH